MKRLYAVLMALTLGNQTSVVGAKPGQDYSDSDKAWPIMYTYFANASLYHDLGIGQETIFSLQSHPVIQKTLMYGNASPLGNSLSVSGSDPVAGYETYLP